jgi:hypothetical protein
VLRSDARTPAGVGVVVGDRHVVTCAHVVNAALGRVKREQARPGADTRVDIDFPLLQDADDRLPRRCRLVAWAWPRLTGVVGGGRIQLDAALCG